MGQDAAPAPDPQRPAVGPARAWRRMRPWLRRSVRVGAALGLATLAVAFGVQAYLNWSTRHWRYDAVDSVPPAPVALVLGSKVNPDGAPSAFLARRLDLAVALYHRGTVRAILVSGDNGSRRYDEVTAMMRYLQAHDVPASRIVGDYAGFDTWDSCTRAHRIFGVDRAVVVTQRFHLPRAVRLCRRAGITAFGLGDDSGRDFPQLTRQLELRELFADVKAGWTLLTRPDPRFLGPQEIGVDRATAAVP
jgi:vancomycin permeability regulator SanA